MTPEKQRGLALDEHRAAGPSWRLPVLILLAALAPFDGRAVEARPVTGPEQQVLKVGPTQRYTLPSQAARAARDGALVEIDAGDYEGDVAVWRQNDLTLRGAGWVCSPTRAPTAS